MATSFAPRIGVEARQSEHEAFHEIISSAANPDAVRAIVGRTFPFNRLSIGNERVAGDRRSERLEKRVSVAGPFRAYLHQTIDEGELSTPEIERLVDLMGSPADLSLALEALTE